MTKNVGAGGRRQLALGVDVKLRSHVQVEQTASLLWVQVGAPLAQMRAHHTCACSLLPWSVFYQQVQQSWRCQKHADLPRGQTGGRPSQSDMGKYDPEAGCCSCASKAQVLSAIEAAGPMAVQLPEARTGTRDWVAEGLRMPRYGPFACGCKGASGLVQLCLLCQLCVLSAGQSTRCRVRGLPNRPCRARQAGRLQLCSATLLATACQALRAAVWTCVPGASCLPSSMPEASSIHAAGGQGRAARLAEMYIADHTSHAVVA